jgi:hypothetical protein
LPDTDIKCRLLADIASLRLRHKQQNVTRALQLEVMQEHVLTARYGELLLLNGLEMRNMSPDAQTFSIEVCFCRHVLLWLHRLYPSIGTKAYKCVTSICIQVA